jgi:hypothetical protein
MAAAQTGPLGIRPWRRPPPNILMKTSRMIEQLRPKLHPPLALLAARPTLTPAYAGSAQAKKAQERPAPSFRSTLAPHELRRIVAAIVG